MKVIKESFDISNINRNMKVPSDMRTEVPADYGAAVEQEKKAEKHVQGVMDELEKKAKEVAMDSPKMPKPVKNFMKSDFTLEESLFEDYTDSRVDRRTLAQIMKGNYEGRKKGLRNEIEELPDNVHTLVYDRLFPTGVKSYKATILADNKISFPNDRYFINASMADYDIGVVVANEAERDFVKDVADFVGAGFRFRPITNREGIIGIAIVKMDDKLANTSARDLMKSKGLSGRGRKEPNQPKKVEEAVEEKDPLANVLIDEEVHEDELTEDAKITIDIYSFEPWSGAVEVYEIIEREGKLDDLDAFIEEMYPDGIRDVDLNDLLRFEPEYVFEAIGLDTSLLD